MTELTTVTAGSNMPHIFTNNRRVIVASNTGIGELAVIDSGRCPGDSTEMTVIAGILTINMARVLAGRPDAIMASEAGRGDFGVIKARRLPGDRTVALVTTVMTLEVSNGFAGGLDPVMTADAGTGNGHVVHARICPADFGMTVIADIAAFDMTRRFACCSDQAGRAMTALTALRGAFEDAVFMAALTSYLIVCTVELETSRVMVEFGSLHELAE